jgi:hypothetical protein
MADRISREQNVIPHPAAKRNVDTSKAEQQQISSSGLIHEAMPFSRRGVKFKDSSRSSPGCTLFIAALTAGGAAMFFTL